MTEKKEIEQNSYNFSSQRCYKNFMRNNKMNNYLFKPLLIIFLINTASLEAEVAPENHKQPSFELSKAAKNIINQYHLNELLSYQGSSNAIKNILNSELSEKEKVQAFVVLLDKVDLLFNGSVILAKNKSYFYTYKENIYIFMQFQNRLKNLNYKTDKIEIIASNSCNKDVVLCSNALLLATLLDANISKNTVMDMSNIKTINNAQRPSILLHNLTISAVLTHDSKPIEKLMLLLPDIKIEEGREDILCAAGVLKSPILLKGIQHFVKTEYLNLFDNSIYTAVNIIKRNMEPKIFSNFFNELKKEDKNKIRIEYLNAMEKNNFKYPLKGSWAKIWDNFNITIYEDGLYIYLDDFHHFRSN